LRTSIGGPILGIIFGFFMSWWMKKIIRDSVLSVMVTFVGAFLCFYVVEFTWLKVSGILSIVCLGLYFSAWILMIIARAIMVLTFYPFIIKSGYGLNIK